MQIEILIPTYNRALYLQNNLLYLKDQILRYDLREDFGIIVSDNGSVDNTWQLLENLKVEWNDEIKLKILHNETNVGLEQNVFNLLVHSTTETILWLGDDDFLADGYLRFVKEQFSNQAIGWMIPGLIGVDKDGSQHEGRPVDFPYKIFPPGYDTVYDLSHLAHQMSGLVVRNIGFCEQYMKRPEWRNPYLFIFFVTRCQMAFKGVYAPSFQTIVNNYNPKAWGYNDIGLLDEVFKSYYYFSSTIGNKKLKKLLLRFLIMHSYRINFDKGLGHVLNQGKQIAKSATNAKGIQVQLYNFLLKEYVLRKLRQRLS